MSINPDEFVEWLIVFKGMVGGGGSTLTYLGTWDASANTPTLTSSTGAPSTYYIVSVAGNTSLDGVNDWQIGDWAVFNGTVWQRIPYSVIASYYRAPVIGASTANIPGTYYNGPNNDGVGATFTVTATGALNLDTNVSVVAGLGYSYLLKNQSAGLENGLWNCITTGATGVSTVFQRRADFNNSSNVLQGAQVTVIAGVVNAGTSWYESLTGVINVGTDPITFAQLQGSSTSVTVSNTYFVSVNGSDTTGTGSVTSPVLTGQKAIDLITARGDASATNPYLISFGAGSFSGSMALPPYIDISGQGICATFIGAVSLTADWNDGLLPETKFALTNVSITDDLNLDLTGVTSTASRYWLLQNLNVTANKTFTLKGLSGTKDTFSIDNVDMTDNAASSGATLITTANIIANNFKTAACTFQNYTGKFTFFNLNNFDPNGAVAFINDAGGTTLGGTVINSKNFPVAPGCTAAGTPVSIFMDATSWRLISLSGGATVIGPALGVATATSINGTSIPTSATLAALGTAQTFTAAQAGAFATLTDAATIAIDSSLSNNFNLTLGGNRTVGVPTNMIAGRSGVMNVRQDITGSRTLGWSWVFQFPGGTAPTLSTSPLSFDQCCYNINSYSTLTVTITIATPGVVTWTAHSLVSGQRIQLTTTGALPTGLSASTTYWVTVIDANTFKLSTSLANAQSATFIATSGTQSGTHTAVNASITITANLANA